METLTQINTKHISKSNKNLNTSSKCVIFIFFSIIRQFDAIWYARYISKSNPQNFKAAKEWEKVKNGWNSSGTTYTTKIKKSVYPTSVRAATLSVINSSKKM